MTEQELSALVENAVENAVRRQLEHIGLLLDTPEQRVNLRRNFDFLTSMRERFDAAASIVGKVVLTALIAALLSAIALGFKLGLTATPPPGPKG